MPADRAGRGACPDRKPFSLGPRVPGTRAQVHGPHTPNRDPRPQSRRPSRGESPAFGANSRVQPLSGPSAPASCPPGAPQGAPTLTGCLPPLALEESHSGSVGRWGLQGVSVLRLRGWDEPCGARPGASRQVVLRLCGLACPEPQDSGGPARCRDPHPAPRPAGGFCPWAQTPHSGEGDHLEVKAATRVLGSKLSHFPKWVHLLPTTENLFGSAVF